MKTKTFILIVFLLLLLIVLDINVLLKQKEKRNLSRTSSLDNTLMSNYVEITNQDYRKTKPVKNKKIKNALLEEMVIGKCGEDYSTIYSNDKYKVNGIFESNKDHLVYYIRNNKTDDGFYKQAGLYEFGYVYNEKVEKHFLNGIYFYRESRWRGIENELKIAFEANSDDDLLNKYGHKLYEFAKSIDNKEGLFLMVFYSDSLSGIETTYDKLFLNIGYNTNNISQAAGYGTGSIASDKFIYRDYDPEEILSSIFIEPKSYPTNARNAIKFHNHIRHTFKNLDTITEEEFINTLKRSFEKGY